MKILFLLGGVVLGYGGAYFLANKRGIPGAVALSNPTYILNGQIAGRLPVGYILPSTAMATVPTPVATS